jgi:glycosyltransferase involved in cell wall biosynthesis
MSVNMDMAKPSVLFVTPSFTCPSTDGAKIRHFNLMKQLALSGWSVSLLSFADSREHMDKSALLEYGIRVTTVQQPKPYPGDWRGLDYGRLIMNLFSRDPYHVQQARSSEFAHELRDLVSSHTFDVVMLCKLQMLQYADISIGFTGATVVDKDNVEYVFWSRYAQAQSSPLRKLYAFVQMSKVKKHELDGCASGLPHLAVSEPDRARLLELCHRAIVYTVPNGVDASAYSPSSFADRTGDVPTIAYVGSMDWHPNRDAVLFFWEHILPAIRRRIAGVRLLVIGRQDPRRAKELAVRLGSGVEVTGLVDDVRPYLEQAQVVVVPLRIGGGTRLKILEAFAMGKPVVSTSLGCEGLNVRHGEQLLVADKPEEFAESVVELLLDHSLAEKLAREGRRLVVEQYDWPVIAKRLLAVFEEILRSMGIVKE